MAIHAIVEYSDKGFLVYADDFPGALRGMSKDEALAKMPAEVGLYCRWVGKQCPNDSTVKVVQEKYINIAIEDADSEVIFDSEKLPLSEDNYESLKALIFKSAKDVLSVFNSIPEKNKIIMQPRKTFFGDVPVSAIEMLSHINTVTEYYITQVGVSMTNFQDLLYNRKFAFSALEAIPNYLDSKATIGSFGEEWSLRKVLRRFIWHDRIHVKAMYRRANAVWEDKIRNPFFFT